MTVTNKNKTPIRKAILLPGNGCPGDGADLSGVMWYGWIAEELQRLGIAISPVGFPDPLYAHEDVWKSFCVNELELDEETLLIGHSSGAACALRLMEDHKTAGCILVSAYDSDLGDAIERESGYFDRPFEWAKMQNNTPFILQFHSPADELVPIASGVAVAKGTQSHFVVVDDVGHFNEASEYPVLLEHLRSHLIVTAVPAE